MSAHFLNIDICAKLPIITVDNEIDDKPVTNGFVHSPSFRLADNYAYKKRHHPAKMKESYVFYEEPSPENLLTTVEYDMDESDLAWLDCYNENHAKRFTDYRITEDDFEKIMDRLEKESYFETKLSGNSVLPEVDEDAICAICSDGDCANANAILFCDMCDLAVHQECYGVPYIPEGQWLCRRCLQSPSTNVDCALCPNKGGAFKQTEEGQWAHVICALWIPEVCFANTVFLEPIDNIKNIPPARWKLNCYICKQKRVGACIQCHKPNCYVPFHVTCAQQAGLYMKIRTYRYETAEGPLTDVKKEAFCDAHAPSDKSSGMYSGDESDDEMDSRAFKKRNRAKMEKMKKTRQILAKKRANAFNPISEPKINREKLLEISKLLTLPKRKKSPPGFDALREHFIQNIEGYWLLKRVAQNGRPLLRRLQVSYNNSMPKQSSESTKNDIKQTDMIRYERLRYDLERARLLVGEVKKRELYKKKLFKISKEVVDKKYQLIDKEKPADEE